MVKQYASSPKRSGSCPSTELAQSASPVVVVLRAMAIRFPVEGSTDTLKPIFSSEAVSRSARTILEAFVSAVAETLGSLLTKAAKFVTRLARVSPGAMV